MVAAQVQGNQPIFFSMVSFRMYVFSWTSHLLLIFPYLGILLGWNQNIRVSTCPSGLSDSWAAEKPEIQDRSIARWQGEPYSIQALKHNA